jgi:hypothetical protein
MHVDRRFLNWGVFFIAVGTVPLAARAGLVPGDVHWWELWPLVLVAWGIGLILGRTAVGPLAGALAAAAIGLIVGGVLFAGAGIGAFGSGCGTGSGTPFASRTGVLAGPRASVDLEPGCGNLDVSVGGGSWQVAGTSRDGAAPEIEASSDRLHVRSADGGFDPFSPAATTWQVRLPENQPIDLSVSASAGTARLALGNARLGKASLTVNAGTTRADFTGSTVETLSVTANAGDARLTLPPASLSGTLTANAGSVGICLPPGAGLRITMSDSLLGGNNFEQHGLAHDGNTWTTAGYASAPARIDLSATANAGSIEIDPDGGCR